MKFSPLVMLGCEIKFLGNHVSSPVALLCKLSSLAALCNDRMYAWKHHKFEYLAFLSNHSFLPDTASVSM